MYIKIVNLDTKADLHDDIEKCVYKGNLEEGARTLMEYTYNRALLYNDMVYVSMRKALTHIAEDFSVSPTEHAYFRVWMEDETPVTLSLYIEGICEFKTEFKPIVIF